MDELIKALTRAANAVAEYYEKQANPMLTEADIERATEAAIAAEVQEQTGKPKRTRKAKAELLTPENKHKDVLHAHAPAAVDDQSDLLGGVASAAAAPATQAVYNEAESRKAAESAATRIVAAFPKPAADGRAEGFHKAKAILASPKFNGVKFSAMTPLQCVAFAGEVDHLIAAGKGA